MQATALPLGSQRKIAEVRKTDLSACFSQRKASVPTETTGYLFLILSSADTTSLVQRLFYEAFLYLQVVILTELLILFTY